MSELKFSEKDILDRKNILELSKEKGLWEVKEPVILDGNILKLTTIDDDGKVCNVAVSVDYNGIYDTLEDEADCCGLTAGEALQFPWDADDWEEIK